MSHSYVCHLRVRLVAFVKRKSYDYRPFTPDWYLPILCAVRVVPPSILSFFIQNRTTNSSDSFILRLSCQIVPFRRIAYCDLETLWDLLAWCPTETFSSDDWLYMGTSGRRQVARHCPSLYRLQALGIRQDTHWKRKKKEQLNSEICLEKGTRALTNMTPSSNNSLPNCSTMNIQDLVRIPVRQLTQINLYWTQIMLAVEGTGTIRANALMRLPIGRMQPCQGRGKRKLADKGNDVFPIICTTRAETRK